MKYEIIDMEASYDEMLDDTVQHWVRIYSGAVILKEVDPIAYRCGYSDYVDSMTQDGYIGLDELEDYGVVACSECGDHWNEDDLEKGFCEMCKPEVEE